MDVQGVRLSTTCSLDVQSRAVHMPFTTTNTNNMDVQGVSLSTTCRLEVQWVMGIPFISTNTSIVWTCRVSPFPLPESVATLPPFGPIEGQKWFDRISSQ